MESGNLELQSADIVGIREAARALKVAPSTISRQVDRGVIPNRGSAIAPKVSIEEARRARAANVDPAQQRASAPAASGFQALRTEHEAIKARRAGLELAERQGELLARRDVEDFFATVGRTLRDRLLHRWRTMSIELEGRPAREIEVKAMAADESVLTTLAQEFEAFIDAA